MTESEALPLVFVVADSISIQYGPYLERALAGAFRYGRMGGEAEAAANLDNPVGANGGDSNRVLAYLKDLAAANFHAEYLLVNCGLHDVKVDAQTKKLQVELDAYEQNLKQIVETSWEIAEHLIWVRTTAVVDDVHNAPADRDFLRYNRYVERYNRAADALMLALEVPAIDLYNLTNALGTAEQLYCDHAHFNDVVRMQQGVYIAGWLTAYHQVEGM